MPKSVIQGEHLRPVVAAHEFNQETESKALVPTVKTEKKEFLNGD
ncbi:hypothetical protein [Microbulbifer taiwanensis]